MSVRLATSRPGRGPNGQTSGMKKRDVTDWRLSGLRGRSRDSIGRGLRVDMVRREEGANERRAQTVDRVSQRKATVSGATRSVTHLMLNLSRMDAPSFMWRQERMIADEWKGKDSTC